MISENNTDSNESEYALQISDFMDRYLLLCSEDDVFLINSLCKTLRDAIDSGRVPSNFNMSGKIEELRRCRLNDHYIRAFLNSLGGVTFLKCIDLSFNEIGCDGAKAIASFIQEDKNLKQLHLQSNNIDSPGGTAIAKALQINDSLHYLDISNNSIGDKAGSQLASTLQINCTLIHLNISGCSLGASSLISLSTALHNNDTLRTLNISNNKIPQSLESDVLMHISKMMHHNVGIVDLDISKFGIGDWTTVNHLGAAIKWNTRVSNLNLSCNRITKDGCIAICKSLCFSQKVLTFLNLSCCAVQDEGAAAIAFMLGKNSTLSKYL
ncbi:hypothetical protein BDR26DRAFT_883122 [Obelidium mucronatum]|nr:hypothetical protein BDR26DRAFT_883122 [Obelidium mucronatum]